MTNFSKYLLLTCLLTANAIAASAQAKDSAATKPVEMADAMRSNGKIYVVVAVLTIIFLGIVFYLVRLEKKIKQLEKPAETH